MSFRAQHLVFSCVLAALCVNVAPVVAELIAFEPGVTKQVDLGDMTSQGSDGLAFRILPADSFLPDRQWAYYPAFEPAPHTPAQSAIALHEGEFLVAAIPLFAHLPWLGQLDVDFSQANNELFIDATLQTSLGMTATIYGPHEYLLQLGTLPAGEYRLNLNFLHTIDPGGAFESSVVRTGYMQFNVLPAIAAGSLLVVPEPSTAALTILGVGLLALTPRRKRARA